MAFSEIKNGQKQSHWMWYVFPQLDLGSSETSKKYAIKSKEEAIEYLEHPILGKRLIEITTELLALKNKSAYEVFGRPDDLKLKSYMTLFASIQNENPIFQQVLTNYFNGKICWSTKNFWK
jgi:uncharacterized protein (DUF1810 family)